MGQGKGKRPLEDQYTKLSYALLKSAAWRSLSGNAMRVWFELHTRLHGGNNGALTLSISEASRSLGMSKATAQKALKELQDKGFLVLDKKGNWYHRRAHEWRMTTKSVHTVKGKVAATNEWRRWQPKNKTRDRNRTVSHTNGSVTVPKVR